MTEQQPEESPGATTDEATDAIADEDVAGAAEAQTLDEAEAPIEAAAPGEVEEPPAEPSETEEPGDDPSADPGDGDTLAIPLAELRPSLEALLMVADQPLDPVTLASAVGHPTRDVEQALTGLAAEYDEQSRGFELRSVAGGWRYYTREEFAHVVEAFVLDGQQARLTQAALETLAVVAYKQPVSRARVSAIRGVNVDGVMRTLLTRGLVEEAGRDGEHGATLYRTSGYFLERIGITSLDELPELAPYLPDLDDLEDEAGELSVASESTTPVAEQTGEQPVEAPAEGAAADRGDDVLTDPSADSDDADPVTAGDETTTDD